MTSTNASTIPTHTVLVDELQIKYADPGTTDAPVTLLTSPWPKSLLAFRGVWPALARTGRLVAIDLPGFGHSEGRADVLTPSAMGNSYADLSPNSGWARHIWSRPTCVPGQPCFPLPGTRTRSAAGGRWRRSGPPAGCHRHACGHHRGPQALRCSETRTSAPRSA
jgi:pimeloyl-ACP methyl ester carboxylesterase